MLALIPIRVWLQLGISAAIIGAGWWAYSWAYDRGADSVRVLWDAEKQDIADQTAAIKAEAQSATDALRAKADTLRRTKDAQITRLNADLANALDGLRDRASRPGAGDLPGDTAAGAGCYPVQLYREDAAVALKLAGDADKLRIDLRRCQDQYNSARDALGTP